MALTEQKAEDTGDYLVAPADQAVLANLSDMAEHLKALRIKVLEYETQYEAAKKEYDYYASSILPMAMYNAGLQKVELLTGGVIRVDHKFRCTPNKNTEDRAVQAEWLKQYGLDKLIDEAAQVKGAQLEALKAANIPYVEVKDINTNKLKAALCDLLGVKGGMAKISITDIPDSFHFQEVTECVIET